MERDVLRLADRGRRPLLPVAGVEALRLVGQRLVVRLVVDVVPERVEYPAQGNRATVLEA